MGEAAIAWFQALPHNMCMHETGTKFKLADQHMNHQNCAQNTWFCKCVCGRRVGLGHSFSCAPNPHPLQLFVCRYHNAYTRLNLGMVLKFSLSSFSEVLLLPNKRFIFGMLLFCIPIYFSGRKIMRLPQAQWQNRQAQNSLPQES